VNATDREIAMARQLIDSLATDFEPEKYRDEYRDRVLDLIERKAQGEEIAIAAEPEAPKAVPDLMAALEASLAAASGGKAKLEATGANGKKNGAKKPKAAPARAKKPAAKKPAAAAKKAPAKKPRAKSRA
jgi:DNA end-binding protein Ku